jgi:hypothetical protein
MHLESKHLLVPPLSDDAKLAPTVCIWRLVLMRKEVEFLDRCDFEMEI